MIPNRFHFIFGLRSDFGRKPFSYVHYLAIATALQINRPKEIVMHYFHEPVGPWWERIKPFVVLSRTRVIDSIHGLPIDHVAHRADVLRLEILQNEGGIYLDADTLCVSPFTPLLGHQAVMGIEPNAGLCNAVILAERGAPFVRAWLDGYRNFNDADWRSHSVFLPYRLARQHPEWIHVEGEYSFFFPSYDDPMHALLWNSDLGPWRRICGLARIARDVPYYLRGNWPVRIFPYFRYTLSSRAAYLERLRKTYCIHLWESLWWERYLRDLSPDSLLTTKGLYAALVVQALGGTTLQEARLDSGSSC